MASSEENVQLWNLAEHIDSSIHGTLKHDLERLKIYNTLGKVINERAVSTGSCAEDTKVNTPNDKGDVDALLISGNVVLDESQLDYFMDNPAFLRVKYAGEHKDYFSESDIADDKYVLADVLRNMNERHFVMHRLILELELMPDQAKVGFTYSHPSAVGHESRTISENLVKSGSIDVKESTEIDWVEAGRYSLEKIGKHVLQNSQERGPAFFGDLLKTVMECVKVHSDAEKTSNGKSSDPNYQTIEGATLVKSMDFVPAYNLKPGAWPRVAQDWIYRQRTWPAPEVVTEILEAGCHVIAKPLPQLVHDGKYVGDGPDVYFRLSFSVSEVLLAKSMNRIQLTCWKILKAYQKGFLETSPKVLTSYHWKNVMFWLCESMDESFWVEDNLSLAVKMALQKMIQYLDEGNLPQYFCRNMNLLGHCDSRLVKMIKNELRDIKEEPADYLGHFLDYPPAPKSYSLDTKEIPKGVTAKLLNTGHTSLCGVLKTVIEREDVEGNFGYMNELGHVLVKTIKQGSLQNSSHPTTKDLIRNVSDVPTTFVENATKVPKDPEEFKNNIKKETVKLGLGVGQAILFNMASNLDIDLD